MTRHPAKYQGAVPHPALKRRLLTGLLIACAALAGCSRAYYREAADKEAYKLLRHKTQNTPWAPPGDFTIDPPPNSRLFEPGDPDNPDLPAPGPTLYRYPLPFGKAAHQARTSTSAAPQKTEGNTVQAIPSAYWHALPRPCLARMLVFESVIKAYRMQFEQAPGKSLMDSAPKLSLQDIVATALLNSREYQTRKEDLYIAALTLTGQHYRHSIHAPDTSSSAVYENSFSEGDTTDESLGIFPGLSLSKLTTFGGSLLASFANQVILTFEGPEGFTREVGSSLFFRFTQDLFQRDRNLEPLIQAERNLIYAARSYLRYRKEFFLQLAGQYYGLLGRYRNIEIEAQNYFSLVRTFEKAQTEVRASVKTAPNPIAVDQYEQSMLSGRSALISRCNALERELDNLKLAIGVPTETAIDLDLSELDQLSLQDETEVASERVKRWQRRVADRRGQAVIDRFDLLNACIFLIERTLQWHDLNKRMQDAAADTARLDILLARSQVELARIETARCTEELNKLRALNTHPPIILIYQRTYDLINAMTSLLSRQIDLAELLKLDPQAITRARTESGAAADRLKALEKGLQVILSATGQDDPDQDDLDQEEAERDIFKELVADADNLYNSVKTATADMEALLSPLDPDVPSGKQRDRDLAHSEKVLQSTESLLDTAHQGLPAVDISLDRAMATALINRTDLMNQRGRLADARRQIKLSADELRSILQLEATHSMRSDDQQPFRFRGDAGTTQVSLRFDLPIDRLNQRNDYRRALMDYQAGRRDLMALEDAIKLGIRDDFRTLEEARIQYPISVTRAALAAEQVISVKLQLAYGVQGVRSTDLLDALQSSREALIAVANARIGYLVDRARFVFNLDIMTLDTAGMWPAINDPAYQPEADLTYPDNAGPTYGDIPTALWVSEEIRKITDHPKPGEIEKLNLQGATNTYRLSPRIITGSQPDGEAGFAALQKLGIKTIVSVTDKNPDAETAKKYGMKYVHVPMDYKGVSAAQRAKILGAATESSEPVYIHCNSGRNRGATAAAICLIGIEGKSSEEAISWMKTRGVDEEKKELYDAVRDYDPEPTPKK